MVTALERAATSAALIDTSEERERSLDQRKEVLLAAHSTLLPIEAPSAAAIKEELNAVSSAKEQIMFARTFALPRLSSEPLRWRREDGFPVLALFSVLFPRIVFQGMWPGETRCQPSAYENLYRRFYPDIFQRLSRRGAGGDTVSLEAEFKGIIPARTKEIIANWERSDVFLLTEVTDWDYEEVASPHIDPLVCLWHADSFWLLDKFDTTTVEEYIAREFTS